MDKKHRKPMHRDFKILSAIFTIALVGAVISSLFNIINDKPFSSLLFIPAGAVLFLAGMRGIIGFGPFYNNHPGHHGKTNVKVVEPPTPEYRGGETFEADLDSPLLT